MPARSRFRSSGSDHPNVMAWMRSVPRTCSPLDETALGKVCEALAEMGNTCARAGQAPVFRAALVKMLSGIEAAPALDLSESDVFAVSHRLREALYLEIMSYRRAARADVEPGSFA